MQDPNPAGGFTLQNATVFAKVEKKGKEKPLFFNVRTPDRDYLLRAASAAEKDDWVRLLKANIKGNGKTIAKQGSFLGKTQEERDQEAKEKGKSKK